MQRCRRSAPPSVASSLQLPQIEVQGVYIHSTLVGDAFGKYAWEKATMDGRKMRYVLGKSEAVGIMKGRAS